jgi:hypothetical protein
MSGPYKMFKNECSTYEIFSRLASIEKMKKESNQRFTKLYKINKTDPIDFHPLPGTHLKYIERYFSVPQSTRNWVLDIENQILNDKFIIFDNHSPSHRL